MILHNSTEEHMRKPGEQIVVYQISDAREYASKTEVAPPPEIEGYQKLKQPITVDSTTKKVCWL